MDKAFWQSIKSNEYTVPKDHSVPALTPELLSYLGSECVILDSSMVLSSFSTFFRLGMLNEICNPSRAHGILPLGPLSLFRNLKQPGF
jgi:hypothetical protein